MADEPIPNAVDGSHRLHAARERLAALAQLAAHCPYCRRDAAAIPSVVHRAHEEGVTPNAVAREDGTYNPTNGHFCCDECYIRIGMPAGHVGESPRWVAP